MRLLFLQYAGDYREAVQRFARGGSETYYAQKYTIEGVAEFVKYADEVMVVCCQTREPYNEVLSNGVRAIGGGFKGAIDEKKVIRLISDLNPSHIILTAPMFKVLNWAIRSEINVLPILVSSLVANGWRSRWRRFKLCRLFANSKIEWIGSYGIASSKLLEKCGVDPDKIIPWDFLIEPAPGSYAAKSISQASAPWKLIYVGSLIESKGVGDILRAVSILRRRDFPVRLKMIGSDSEGVFAKLSRELEIADIVEFPGTIPNDRVVPAMREADAVLVTSRHDYTEGFPLTIHHALCARTPLIASDHPMFRENLENEVNAIIYPAADPAALASAIENLFGDPELYYRLSVASYECWYRLRLPVKWFDLINRWVVRSEANNRWIYEHRLSAYNR